MLDSYIRIRIGMEDKQQDREISEVILEVTQNY